MTPEFKNNGQKKLTVRSLSGGVNLRDNISDAGDNQLTELKNMWFKNGFLSTRPAFKPSDTDAFVCSNGDTCRHFIKSDCTYTENGKTYVLTGFIANPSTGTEGRICLRYVCTADPDDFISLPEIVLTRSASSTNLTWDCVIYRYKSDIYCLVRENYANTGLIAPLGIYKISGNTVSQIEEEDIYAPIVATNCLPECVTARGESPFGDNCEAYNAICSYYRMRFSTVDRYAEGDGNEMVYPIIESLWSESDASGLFDCYVTAEIRTRSKTYIHKVYLEPGSYGGVVESVSPGDGLLMSVSSDSISFVKSSDQSVATAYKSNYLKNNLTITLPRWANKEAKNRVFNMTLSTCYGGSVSGRGDRIFLAGNLISSNQAVLVWSDRDNPLYFPENCSLLVGDTSQKITFFGKQAGNLVIFKEKEIYYLTAAQSTVRETGGESEYYPATAVTFPVSALHSGIGCDCPQTVALCCNRLVWATSEGRVYQLRMANQQGARNIYCISSPVARRMESEPPQDMQNAAACSFGSMYALSVGNRIYLCECNSYGYNNASSFTKEGDIAGKTPWWYWELPEEVCPVYLVSGKPVFSAAVTVIKNTDDQSGEYIYYLTADFSAGNDIYYSPSQSGGTVSASVSPCFTTKYFDFGDFSALKRISSVSAEIACNGGDGITVNFITDGNCVSDYITLTGQQADSYQPGGSDVVTFRPMLNPANRMGISMSAKGCLKVGAVTVAYSTES